MSGPDHPFHAPWRLVPLLAALIITPGVPRLACAQQNDVDARIYDVELVVFRNLNEASFGTPEVLAPPPEDALADIAPDPLPLEPAATLEPEPMPEGIAELPADRHRLDAIDGALKRSGGYRPLAHIGWSQPGYARGLAPRVPLDQQLDGTGLAGSARLAVGRYLHLELELTYQTDDGRIRTLTQSRRMRSGERHYFDDPGFGVIAVVSRRDDER